MTFLYFLIGLGLGCYLGFRFGVVSALGLDFRILSFNKDLFAWRQLYDVNKIPDDDKLLLAYEIKREDAEELFKTQQALERNLSDD